MVVARGQTCGVPGRYIGENVAFLRDVVDLDIEYNLPVALLSLDQERAFDRVDWLFLFAILTRMGFGDNFIRWLKLLYTDVRSSVLANGYTTRHFKPSRGVRQGCPLSPLLYVLSMAPAIIVRHVLFGFSSDELLCVPLVFCYLWSLLKFFVWCQRKNYRFRSKPPSAVGLIAVACLFTCPCFSNAYVLGAGAFSSNVIGELMAVSVRSLVTPSIYVFSSPNVCVSLSLGLLGRLCFGCTVVSFGLVLSVPSSFAPLGRLYWLYCGFLGSELALLESACLPSLCSPRSPLLAVLWFSWL